MYQKLTPIKLSISKIKIISYRKEIHTNQIVCLINKSCGIIWNLMKCFYDKGTKIYFKKHNIIYYFFSGGQLIRIYFDYYCGEVCK